MRSELCQFVFYVTAFVLGGALEELLPKWSNVGFPVLLALAACMAVRKPAVSMVLAALAAGGVEDALSSLPPLVSPCFFLVAAIAARRTRLAKTVVALAYPLYQLWLALTAAPVLGSAGIRVLVAVPIGFVTVLAVDLLLSWAERKAAVDES